MIRLDLFEGEAAIEMYSMIQCLMYRWEYAQQWDSTRGGTVDWLIVLFIHDLFVVFIRGVNENVEDFCRVNTFTDLFQCVWFLCYCKKH